MLGNLSGIGKLKAMTLKVTVTLMVVLESLKIFHLLYNVVLLKLILGILNLIESTHQQNTKSLLTDQLHHPLNVVT